MDSIRNMLLTCVGANGGDVRLELTRDNDTGAWDASIVSSDGSVVTAEHDWSQLLNYTHTTAAGALDGLEQICKEDGK